MKAIQVAAFFNGQGAKIHDCHLYVTDAASAKNGSDVTGYPILRVDVDEQSGDVLLVLRFPDDEDGGNVYANIAEFLSDFLPVASNHPNFEAEASIPMKVMNFSRFDMTLMGTAFNEKQRVVLLLADGLKDIEGMVTG